MTVCIGAVCVAGNVPAIVLCADMKGSSPLGSKQKMLKDNEVLADGHWRCLAAGTDDEVNAFVPLLRQRLQALLPDINETNVVEAVQLALQARKLEKSNEFTSGRWGLSFADFRQSKVGFPEDQFEADMRDIAHIEIDADCIISGFLSDGLPMLLVTDAKCSVKIKEDWAVAGEGAYLAQSGMMHRDHYDTFTLEQTIYCVYEAKRYAQRISTVGEHTHLVIYRDNEPPQVITEEGLDYLEAQFGKYGPQDLPDGSIVMQSDFVKEWAPKIGTP